MKTGQMASTELAKAARVPYRTVRRFVTGRDVRPATLRKLLAVIGE